MKEVNTPLDALSPAQRSQLDSVNGLENKLVWSIYKGSPDLVEYFIQEGALVDWTDQDNMSALYKSGRDGKHEASEILIRYGANMEHDGDRGSTALYVASQNGHTKCVEVLLEYGAYVEAKFTGYYSPIYVASQKGFKSIVERLIKHGANLESPCPNGSTALFVGSQNGHHKVVELLLSHGAKTEVLFKSKTTPLEQAALRSHRECVQTLLQYGAQYDHKKGTASEVENMKQFVHCRKVLHQKRGKPVRCMMVHNGVLYMAFYNDHVITSYDILSDVVLGRFEGHQDDITCMAICYDRLYTGSLDKTIMCWDVNVNFILMKHTPDELQTGELLDTMKGHTEAITCMIYYDRETPLAKSIYMYTGSADRTVIGWGSSTRRIKFEGHKGPITCILAKHYKIYTMNYDMLYTASADGTIRVNSIVGAQCLLELTGHEGAIFCMVENDDILYTGSADNTIRCWDSLRGKCVHIFEGHTDSVTSMEIHESVLYSGSTDRTMRSWGCKTRRNFGVYEGHTGPITCTTMEKGIMYTGSADETIRMWELTDDVHHIVGEKLYSVDTKKVVLCVSIGKESIYTGTCYDIRHWNKKTGEMMSTKSYKSEGVMCMYIQENGGRFFTAGINQIITVWDLHEVHFIAKIPTLSPITCMTISDDNELFAGLADGTARSWKIYDEGARGGSNVFSGHSARVSHVLVYGDILFTSSDSPFIQSWCKLTGDAVRVFLSQSPVYCLVVDGRILYGGCRDVIQAWDVDTGRELDLKFVGHSGKILCLEIWMNSLYSSSVDKTIRKWNKQTGELLFTFRGHTGPITCLVVDEEFLLSGGSSDHTVNCWLHQEDPLLWATHYGMTDMVQADIERNPSEISRRDPLDRNLLMIACSGGHVRLTEWLLKKDMKMDQNNSRDQSPLFFALQNNHWNLLSHLHQLRIPMKIQPGTACDTLLKDRSGIEFDVGNLIEFSSHQGHVDLIPFFVEEFRVEVSEFINEQENDLKIPVVDRSALCEDLPERDRGTLSSLFSSQNQEIQHLAETMTQMQKMFIHVQNSLSSIVSNQQKIRVLLSQPKENEPPPLAVTETVEADQQTSRYIQAK
ncbi:wd40 repeat, subgroup [Planoprotostelium fungivorum]|uniref:Wd40 repeat, subgroup n=1 Tax=Planoprotostelium fungivorum TaxID=1890364 RepID=A0A2P6NWQ5_9EUKA|nr:wd40 repeat, subgroup [Planoprotostelium fungivorum]